MNGEKQAVVAPKTDKSSFVNKRNPDIFGLPDERMGKAVSFLQSLIDSSKIHAKAASCGPYEQGFIEKCAEYGITEEMLKEAGLGDMWNSYKNYAGNIWGGIGKGVMGAGKNLWNAANTAGDWLTWMKK